MRVDTRPLLQQVQQLREVVKVNSEQIQGLDRKFAILDRKVDEVRSNVALILRLVQQGQSPQSTSNADSLPPGNVVLPVPAMPVPAMDAAESVNAVVSLPCYDTLTIGRYPNSSIPMAMLFKSWFDEDLPGAYKNFKQKMNRQPAGANYLAKLEKKKYLAKLGTHFSMTKRAMHCMIKNLEDYPKEGDDYEMLAMRAFQSMRSKYPGRFHRTGGIARNTVKKLFKEQDYESKPWPIDTPQSIIAFFDDKGTNKSGYHG